MDIRIYYVKELIKENKIKLEYIKTQLNIADGFTKYLNNTGMDKFRNCLLANYENINL